MELNYVESGLRCESLLLIRLSLWANEPFRSRIMHNPFLPICSNNKFQSLACRVLDWLGKKRSAFKSALGDLTKGQPMLNFFFFSRGYLIFSYAVTGVQGGKLWSIRETFNPTCCPLRVSALKAGIICSRSYQNRRKVKVIKQIVLYKFIFYS